MANGAILGDDCGCGAALKKDLILITKSQNQKLAYFNTIDKETFDLFKQRGGFSLGIPVLDGIFSASGNWDEFRERRDKYFQSIGYTRDTNQDEQEIRIITQPIAYQAWSECMRACSQKRIGFHGWKELENEDAVIATVYYNSPPGGNAIELDGSLVNGRVDGAPADKVFPVNEKIDPNASKTVLIHRTKAKGKLTAVISAKGYPGVTIESEWGVVKPDPQIGTARLRITMTETTERLVGPISTWIMTPNEHNTGHWSVNTMELRVGGTNRVIRNLNPPACQGPDPVTRANLQQAGFMGQAIIQDLEYACRFMKDMTYAIVEGGQRAIAQFATGSKPTYWVFSAQEFEIIHNPKPNNFAPITIYKGRAFDFFVPNYATSAVIEADFGGSKSLATPGQDSADGKLKFITSVQAADGKYYQYKTNE